MCSDCKLHVDAISSGGFSKNLNRESRHFRCQAKHTDFMFPTDHLVDDDQWKSSSRHSDTSNDKAASIRTVENPSKNNSLSDVSVDESGMRKMSCLVYCLLESRIMKLNQVVKSRVKYSLTKESFELL